jgi:hypothetical protein
LLLTARCFRPSSKSRAFAEPPSRKLI